MIYKIELSVHNPAGYNLVGWDGIYFAGYDRVEAEHLIRIIGGNGRINIEQRKDGLYICLGDHDASDSCDYQKYISYDEDTQLDIYKQCQEYKLSGGAVIVNDPTGNFIHMNPDGSVVGKKNDCCPEGWESNGLYCVRAKPIDCQDKVSLTMSTDIEQAVYNAVHNSPAFRKQAEHAAETLKRTSLLMDERGKWAEGIDPWNVNDKPNLSTAEVIDKLAVKELKEFAAMYPNPNKLLKLPSKPHPNKPLIHVQLPAKSALEHEIPGLYVAPVSVEVNLELNKLHIRVSQLENQLTKIQTKYPWLKVNE